jgi:hypothetical protein
VKWFRAGTRPRFALQESGSVLSATPGPWDPLTPIGNCYSHAKVSGGLLNIRKSKIALGIGHTLDLRESADSAANVRGVRQWFLASARESEGAGGQSPYLSGPEPAMFRGLRRLPGGSKRAGLQSGAAQRENTVDPQHHAGAEGQDAESRPSHHAK